MFFAGGVGEDFDFAELGFEEAGGYGAVFEGEGVEVKVGIDVAVGVEDVLAEALGAAGADAVELRADEAAFALDLMAGGAVHFEDVGSDFEMGLGFGESGGAGGDEGVELLALLR